MSILQFDKMSTYGLLRNTKNNEYYFISGFQLLKTMLSCKSIKTKIISEKEFHSLKKPQKYLVDNPKGLIIMFLIGFGGYKLIDYYNEMFISNSETGILLALLYVSMLVILIIITKINESKFKNNYEKVIQLSPRIIYTNTETNSTKKRLRVLLGVYIFFNVMAILVIFNVFSFIDNVIVEFIFCVLPWSMILAVQNVNLSFKRID